MLTPPMLRLSILVGEQIQRRRNIACLSRREAAERTGISERFYAEIELGTAVVTLQTIEKIADVTGWDICSTIGEAR